MKTICSATLKGGASKTMNLFNIAGILSEKHRVLMIDVDPQSNLSTDCGVNIAESDVYSVKDIFESSDAPSPDDVIIKAPISELPKLDLISSSIFLFETEAKLITRSDRERVLERYFADHKDVFGRYDYVFIDTNPSMSVINQNAFLIADEIMLSCDVSANSIQGAELFCRLWDERRKQLRKEDNIGSLIISNYNSQSNLAKDLMEFTRMKEFSKDIVCDTVINHTVRLKETESFHKPINVLYPKHKAAMQYRALVKELKRRGVL